MNKCKSCNNNIDMGQLLSCPNCGEKFCSSCAQKTKKICPKCYHNLEISG